MLSNLSLQELLTTLGKMIETGEASKVLPIALKLNKQFPNEPNILHLIALAQAQKSNKKDSKLFFKRSLEIKKNQPFVHNNFANFLKQQKQIKLARHHYNQAIYYHPKFAEAWRNLAILEYETGNLNTAYEHALKASEIAPDLLATLTLLGNICRKKDQLKEATNFFQAARKKDPKNVNAIYGLAITYSDLEKTEEALTLFEEALSLAPTMSEALYSKALVELNLGHQDSAIETLKKLIDLNPLHAQAHKTLNEVYWQLGNTDLFCSSYLKLTKEKRGNKEIAIPHIENLIAAGLIEDAQSALDNWPNSSNKFESTFLRARIEEEKGDLVTALQLYETAYSLQSDFSITKQYLAILMKTQNFERANKLVSQALVHSPDDQLLWAIQGTCWKILNDERHLWLNANGDYIREYVIPTPSGFSNLGEFLLTLKEELLKIHNLKERPLFQSVRSGVQTPGRLLHKNRPIIHTLKESLKEATSQYILNLPEEKEHPFLGKKSINFKFSGSWSVMLKNSGHHVSHVHTQGWISSAFYVEIPPSTSKRTPKDAGDIYFGKSPYQLGDKDFIEKQITPQKGTLVLFPSYTWHGTVPLSNNTKHLRITTPFDVIPNHR
ncbi:tetratricopeptide repeat protein [Microbulbifer sp. VAAC004]|uniref:tetratricopeptide repeat protein n=1 Tax=unclassified Microbulbifer TaxID=2619833 RepID=UPI00403A040C